MSDRSPSTRKRILSDYTKPKTNTSSGNSSVQKNRELPNLTECHSCGYRTEMGSSKNQIQTLYSEWRIVLLFPKCYRRVDSSEICSYCFKETSREDCCSCSQCKRSLQTTCFREHIARKRRIPIPRVELMEKKALVTEQAVELDDVEFAFRLLRSINTSPRIFKNTKLIAAGSTRVLSCLKPTKIVYARRKKIESTEIVTEKPVHIVYARCRDKA